MGFEHIHHCDLFFKSLLIFRGREIRLLRLKKKAALCPSKFSPLLSKWFATANLFRSVSCALFCLKKPQTDCDFLEQIHHLGNFSCNSFPHWEQVTQRGIPSREQALKGWVVHLISMHNPDVLTQAKLSPGPMGDLYFTTFFFSCLKLQLRTLVFVSVLHTAFSMQGKVGFRMY